MDIPDRKIDASALVDIRDVQVQKNLPQKERIKSFVKQIKTPLLL